MSVADNGTGASITFGTSGISLRVNSIDWDGIERVSIDTTHLGTTTARTFIPGDLYDPGMLNVEVQFDPSTALPMLLVAETITLSFPIPAGSSTHPTWAASGFITKYKPGVKLEALMTGTLEIKFSGQITVTAAT